MDKKTVELELKRILEAIPEKYGKKTIYGIQRHVSNTGMSRGISLKAVNDGELVNLDYLVSRVSSHKFHKQGGLKVSGCGMDMGFHLADCMFWAIGEGKDWQSKYHFSWI